MPERVQIIDYRGFKIILEDFTQLQDEELFIQHIREAQKVVHTQPPKSARILIDLTGVHFTQRVTQVSKEVSDSNTPFVKATAMVGVAGLMPIMVRAISTFTRRELATFPARDEALEWLIKQ